MHFRDPKYGETELSVKMKNGVKIENVNKCEYLGATLYSDIKHKHVSEVVRNFKVSVNNLIADFSYLESTTLSRLFISLNMENIT